MAAELPPHARMFSMLTGYWVSQSLYAAAKLGVADVLKKGATDIAELAKLTGANESCLHRLLRALSSVGVFSLGEDNLYHLTPVGELLCEDHPASLKYTALMLGDPTHYVSWRHITEAIKTGENGFKREFGMEFFEYLPQHPSDAALFDKAMGSVASMHTKPLLDAYDFSGLRSVVDVAGGQGQFLMSVLEANPTMTGINFDVPDVVDRARAFIASNTSVAERCELEAGSFFEKVPSGADAYILKHILHDWDDEQCLKILKTCHAAMKPTSKLLIMEQVLPEGNEPHPGKFLDLNMMILCQGALERTAAEYSKLLVAAGFDVTRVIPTMGLLSIVEAVPSQQ